MAIKGEGFEVKREQQSCLSRGKELLEAFLVVQGRSCTVDEGGGVARVGEKEGESEAGRGEGKFLEKNDFLPNLHIDFFMLRL